MRAASTIGIVVTLPILLMSIVSGPLSQSVLVLLVSGVVTILETVGAQLRRILLLLFVLTVPDRLLLLRAPRGEFRLVMVRAVALTRCVTQWTPSDRGSWAMLVELHRHILTQGTHATYRERR